MSSNKDIKPGQIVDDELEMLLKASSRLRVPTSAHGKEFAWNRLMKSIEEKVEPETKIAHNFSQLFWYSIAASIVLIFSISVIWHQYATTEMNANKGQIVIFTLPDNSEVTLNADSKLVYRKYGWSAQRIVKMNGEAYFKVQKSNCEFVVETETGNRINVLGTEFNVFERDGKFEVACCQGKVKVETQQNKAVILSKGNVFFIKDQGSKPQQLTIDTTHAITWVTGDFSYLGTPLLQVFMEMERQFNIVVKPEGFDPTQRYYTGYFNNKQLHNALNLVCIPMDLEFKISEDSSLVTITSK